LEKNTLIGKVEIVHLLTQFKNKEFIDWIILYKMYGIHYAPLKNNVGIIEVTRSCLVTLQRSMQGACHFNVSSKILRGRKIFLRHISFFLNNNSREVGPLKFSKRNHLF
jgi:hypothetical protein